MKVGNCCPPRVANQEASAPPAAKVASSLDKAAIASNLEATKNAESREPTVGEDSKLTRSLSMPDSLPKVSAHFNNIYLSFHDFILGWKSLKVLSVVS